MKNVEIIAHTASVKSNLENLKKLINEGLYDQVELDFRMTKDGILVWSHKSTHNGSRIANVDYKYVKDLMTLEEVLEVVNKQKKLLLDIKGVKNLSSDKKEKFINVLEPVRIYNEAIGIESFNFGMVKLFLQLKEQGFNNLEVGLIINIYKNVLYHNNYDPIFNDFSFLALASGLFELPILEFESEYYRTKYPKVKQYAWSWDAIYDEKEKRIKKYLEHEVDGIFTLQPELVRSLIK